jgi:hypothetical protein
MTNLTVFSTPLISIRQTTPSLSFTHIGTCSCAPVLPLARWGRAYSLQTCSCQATARSLPCLARKYGKVWKFFMFKTTNVKHSVACVLRKHLDLFLPSNSLVLAVPGTQVWKGVEVFHVQNHQSEAQRSMCFKEASRSVLAKQQPGPCRAWHASMERCGSFSCSKPPKWSTA